MSKPRMHLKAGEVVFSEGDPPTSAFLIDTGRIQVVTTQGDELVVLGELGPGDLLGEMAMIDDSPRTATARALTDSVLVTIDHDSISERLEAADPLVRALLSGQMQRYRSTIATLRGDLDTASRTPTALFARDAEVEAQAKGKIRLESQLREALERRALQVWYQPIQHIASARIDGYEALIRWEHPERGQVSPVEFIKLAEETSLILPVGRYVFEEVCETLAELQRAGRDLPFVAVNVSARQTLEEGVLEELVRVAARNGIPVGAVKLEITESLTLDVERVGCLIERCHDLGIRVALDDFGTGYSNLGHLHKLRFDTVKLDQGFVRQMLHDPRSLAIVRAIVAMVTALGSEMVAEGVETAEQLTALQAIGATYAQGWLIGRPMSREQLLAQPH